MADKRVKDTLSLLTDALCADFGRRDAIIREGLSERRVENELRYLNYKILDAANEVVGERLAMQFIGEIGGAVGYARSSVSELFSESTYKYYKSAVKKNIARSLYLF